MPLQKLQFRPGLNREGTDYSNEGGWYDGDKIRFRSGFPEKIGGWLKYNETQFVGVCRSLFNWVTSDGNNLLSLGTNKKVYVEAGGFLFDITPVRAVFIVPSSTALTSSLGSVSVNAAASYTASGNAGTGAVGDVTVSIT